MKISAHKDYGTVREYCMTSLSKISFAKITKRDNPPIGIIVILPIVIAIMLAFETYEIIQTIRLGISVGIIMGFVFGTLILVFSVTVLVFDCKRVKRKSSPITYYLVRDGDNLFKLLAKQSADNYLDVYAITWLDKGKSLHIIDNDNYVIQRSDYSIAEESGYYQFLIRDFGLIGNFYKKACFSLTDMKINSRRVTCFFKKNLESAWPVLFKRRKIIFENNTPKTIRGQKIIKIRRADRAKNTSCQNARYDYSLVNHTQVKLRIPLSIRERVKQSEFPLPAGDNINYR